jgi:tetratricopeptide (TPR) repeat protein
MGAKKAAPPAESRAVKVFVTALFPAVLAGGLFVGLPDRFMRTGKSLLKDGRRAEARAALARSVALAPWSDEARDWKGRAEEPAEADREFEAASRLNPFEPYYPYHRAMAVGRRSPSEAMVYYRRAAELDPGDPAIRFLCGVSLLRQNRKHEPEPERAALGFLATAVRLDPDMGVRVYRALWRYRSDLRFLESFCEAVPESLDSFLDFMKVSDRWGVYRKYLLKKEGVDPAGIEALLRAARSGTPAAISPAYFIDSPGKPFRSEGFLYANGQLSRRVTVNCRGPVRFAIRARGTRALGYYPCLVIRWDGRVVDVLTLESAEFKDYETALETGEGAHELAIEYVNDRAARAAAGGQPEDRNLWIDKMELSLPC